MVLLFTVVIDAQCAVFSPIVLPFNKTIREYFFSKIGERAYNSLLAVLFLLKFVNFGHLTAMPHDIFFFYADRAMGLLR